MTVYFMAFIQKIHAVEALGQYAQSAPATVDRAGGTRLAAGLRATGATPPGIGVAETIEGAPAEGVSLISFPDRKSFDAWYHSDDYQEALKLRKIAADTQVVIVETP